MTAELPSAVQLTGVGHSTSPKSGLGPEHQIFVTTSDDVMLTQSKPRRCTCCSQAARVVCGSASKGNSLVHSLTTCTLLLFDLVQQQPMWCTCNHPCAVGWTDVAEHMPAGISGMPPSHAPVHTGALRPLPHSHSARAPSRRTHGTGFAHTAVWSCLAARRPACKGSH